MSEEKKKTSYISTIITAIIIVGGIWFWMNKEKFSNKEHYTTYFRNVEGLTVSSQVTLNGAIVGKVSEAHVIDSGIKVTLAINPGVKIKVGTTAKLISAGMAGGKTVKLVPGLGEEYIPVGGMIVGIDNKSMFGKQGTLGAAIRTGKIMLRTTDSILTDISTLVSTAAIKDIQFQLTKLNKQSGEASKTSREYKGTGEGLAKTVHEMNTSVANLEKDSREWPNAIADAEKQSESLVKSTAELEKNMTSISASLKKLKPIFDKAGDKKTALGKALDDKQDYHTANKQFSEVNKGAQEAMARPSAYWFAIFGSNK